MYSPFITSWRVRGKKYLCAEVTHSYEKNMTLEYMRFLLKNKSNKTERKGRLNPPSELDSRVGK